MFHENLAFQHKIIKWVEPIRPGTAQARYWLAHEQNGLNGPNFVG